MYYDEVGSGQVRSDRSEHQQHHIRETRKDKVLNTAAVFRSVHKAGPALETRYELRAGMWRIMSKNRWHQQLSKARVCCAR